MGARNDIRVAHRHRFVGGVADGTGNRRNARTRGSVMIEAAVAGLRTKSRRSTGNPGSDRVADIDTVNRPAPAIRVRLL
jgi:hypothetical protein